MCGSCLEYSSGWLGLRDTFGGFVLTLWLPRATNSIRLEQKAFALIVHDPAVREPADEAAGKGKHLVVEEIGHGTAVPEIDGPPITKGSSLALTVKELDHRHPPL